MVSRVALSLLLLSGVTDAIGADWPMFGRDQTRNPVVRDGDAPTEWDVKTGRNIKWVAQLGSQTWGNPIIAGGQIFIGTNNHSAYLKRYPKEVDLGCLLCFRESDGEFLWQFTAPKLAAGRVQDWPVQGIGGSPLVEGERMWFVSNRYEVVCLDTLGFRDGENDGPVVDEPVTTDDEADVVWRFDMIGELGILPHCAGMGPDWRCSPAASYKGRIYIVTGNGVDLSHFTIPAPDAPSLVCLDQRTGEVLWTDASPGENILHTQVASPLVVEIGGRGHVVVPQGDGWVRSFDALTGELVWEFDLNPKESKWTVGGSGNRNNILATPVFHRGRVFIASGQEGEHGEGPGRLVCLDPTKTGDVSSELAVDAQGRRLSQRRIQAVNPDEGERAIPNPNSALIWEYKTADRNGDGKIEFEEEFHRMFTSVAIRDDLLVAADLSGLVLGIDVRTGIRKWAHDPFAMVWCQPLIVGDKVFVGDDDGMVTIYELSADPEYALRHVDRQQELDNSIHATAFANGVLYFTTRNRLYAIADSDARPNGEADDNQKSGRSGTSTGKQLSTRRTSAVTRVPKPPFASTPQDVVEAMLKTAAVKAGETVVDLGSGDGRIVVTAAKQYGAQAIGYEIDADLVRQSRRAVADSDVSQRAEIRRQDMYTADLSDVDVVVVFLYEPVLEKLKPQFAQMKSGARIVSHHFEIQGVAATRTITVDSAETGIKHRVTVYETPLQDRDGRRDAE